MERQSLAQTSHNQCSMEQRHGSAFCRESSVLSNSRLGERALQDFLDESAFTHTFAQERRGRRLGQEQRPGEATEIDLLKSLLGERTVESIFSSALNTMKEELNKRLLFELQKRTTEHAPMLNSLEDGEILQPAANSEDSSQVGFHTEQLASERQDKPLSARSVPRNASSRAKRE